MISFELYLPLQTNQGILPLDVRCEIADGRLAAIYGSSGAGKTTVLRVLAGLLTPQSGKIVVNNEVWLDTAANINIPPQKRSAGMVFQDYALFPNMTVRENLEYALRKNESKKTIDELLEIIEIGELATRKPDSLSGGQKQRVALARALVRRPSLLLLDEPFSALDRQMRGKLQEYVANAHVRYGLTTILVSHDISEIFRMSHLVFCMDAGKIIRQGPLIETFGNQPASGEVQFVGEILGIERGDIVHIVSILVAGNIVKVAVQEEDMSWLRQGGEVLVISQGFNPIICPIRTGI